MGIVSGGGASRLSQSVTLSSAQLLDLKNTPVTLVTAPPALSYNVPVRVFYTFRAVTTPYVVTDTGAIRFQGSATSLMQLFLDILTGAASQANYENEGQGAVFTLTEALGKALRLTTPNTAPTGGDGTLEVTTEYVTITP